MPHPTDPVIMAALVVLPFLINAARIVRLTLGGIR